MVFMKRILRFQVLHTTQGLTHIFLCGYRRPRLARDGKDARWRRLTRTLHRPQAEVVPYPVLVVTVQAEP